MTHIPDTDKESGRRGKAVAICGRVVSLRKMVTHGSGCPECLDLDYGCTETLVGVLGINAWADLQLDRRGFIAAGKFWKRRRWRS